MGKWANTIFVRGRHDTDVFCVLFYLDLLYFYRQRAAIAQAFMEYRDKTCINFSPKEDHDYDYIYIKRNLAFGLVFDLN